jgi:hypothetical protein
LLAEAHKRQLTGVALKDETTADTGIVGLEQPKFLF